ncbi:MAG: glycerophosphodiester phosphodiesterase family protein, partial [Pseudomonadota bacterium]
MNTTVPFDRVIPPVPWIVGHRGAAGLAPENTLPGIRRGLACGVQGIEIDVHWAHEILWVLHDDTLSRTTNLQGRLDTLSVEQLNAADAGAGARIPRLTDVLAAVPGNSLLNIELKGQRTGAPVAHALEAEAPRALLVTSFRWEELDAYRAAGGSAPIGVLAPRLNDRVLRA